MKRCPHGYRGRWCSECQRLRRIERASLELYESLKSLVEMYEVMPLSEFDKELISRAKTALDTATHGKGS